MTVTEFPGQKPASIIGPPINGNRVIIDGRIIPRLRAHETADGVQIILDDRFGIDVSREMAYPVAHMIAQALAIGQGYPSIEAESADRPFAPEYMLIG